MRHLRAAIAFFTAEETPLYAHPARRRLGRLLGGAEGAALVAESDAWMAAQGVRNPERLTAMVLPGWNS